MGLVLGLFENPLPAPLNNEYGVFLLDLLIWIGVILLVYFVVEVILRQVTKKTKTELDDIIFAIVRIPIIALLILYAFKNSLYALTIPQWVHDYVDKGYFLALLLIGIYIAFKVFKNVVIYYGKKMASKTDTDIDDVLVPLAEKLGMVVIAIVGVAIILAYMGIDLTMLAVGSIVISMVVAYALQDTLSNFFAGIYLITDRPFEVGDKITLPSGEICRVEHIGMRSTRLYNIANNTMIILPNNKIANDKIVNDLKPDKKYLMSIKTNVAPGTDVKKVKKMLFEIAVATPHVLKGKDKDPVVRLTNFGDSSLEFTLFVWIDNFDNNWAVAGEIREKIVERFAEEGLVMPLPQMIVWQKGEPEQT